MSTDKPDVYIDEKAVAAIDAKIKQNQEFMRGVMTSWGNPLEGIKSGPAGTITPPKPPERITTSASILQTMAPTPGSFIRIPAQGIKSFKRILELCDTLEVRLSEEQKKMLLESIQSVPTPRNIMDAKAIFELIEALSK